MSLELKLPNFPGEIQRGLSAPTPPLLPSPLHGLASSPPACRGEVSQDLPLARLLGSPPGVQATRVPRRTRRATERQSRLMFVASQEGF